MPRRAVIFDLDGTLVDSAPDLMAATNHILRGLGRRPITMAEVRSFVGHGARALVTRGLTATGGLPADFDLEATYKAFVAYYADHIADGSTVFEGLEPLLQRLTREGYALGVCTNKLEGLSVQLLKELRLASYFGAVVGPDTLGVAKPDPRPYAETLARLGGGFEASVMVGDSETDILTARAAGVPVLAVPFGYTPQPVSTFNPDKLIAHYDEAWPALIALFEKGGEGSLT